MASQIGLKIKYGILGTALLHSAAACSAATPSEPQIPRIIRSTTEAGRINMALTKSNTSLPAVIAPESMQEKSVGHLSPEAAKITFTLKKIEIDGEQAISQSTLTAPYQSYLGKRVALSDIETMAHDMTLRYQKAGYILTRVIIPPQHISDGVITLRVIEGYIDKIYVQGDVSSDVMQLLKKYGEKIRKLRPLQVQVLERFALLANDLSGVTARIVLAPSANVQGAADLTFLIEQQKAMAYFNVDNRGTKFLGPEQATGGMQINSVLRPGDTSGMQYLTSGNKELNFLQLNHSTPLGTDGLRFNVNAGYTRSLPGSSLKEFEIVGRSSVANAELSYPIIRARDQNLSVHAGVGTLNSQTTILDQKLYDDRIRFVKAGSDYSQSDHWLGLNELAAELTQGLNIFGASQDAYISRPDATPKFTKYTMSLSRLQSLPADFSLLIGGQGQYTKNALYAAEQFGFGGNDFGRGYDPSEITGDRGLAGKVELRYDIKQQQLYAFYDIGSIWNVNTLTQPAKQSGASAGVGARLNLTRWLSGNLEIDKPLTNNVIAEGNRNWRVYFGLSLSDVKNYKSTNLPSDKAQ